MSLERLKQLRTSVTMTALLAGALTVGACQQKQEPEQSLEDDISAEQSVPMSADPAEPNDVIVAPTDASASQVEDDTVASVNGGVTQINYLCAPELQVEATYKDADNQVVLATAQGTATLMKTNDASNPEVFEAATGMDGKVGFVQWRVAHEARETGVMRTAGADAANVSTYECKKTS
ncbi:hypothetical protein [Psychrobacter glaciei]|uniref:hypothetical protein n=1 Tax=Psychrobacter glaciei TaxID=619771 RepID=UPI001F064B6F|nr:hypothetical protein [Psychrobacter glaciei]MCH1783374.1 hypothetical protein [Psychrobacter glaciei]